MKIKAFRYSGHPVKVEELELFKKEWKEIFDRAHKKCGKDMLRMQKLLSRVESILGNKYKTIEEWDILETVEQWKEKMDLYGNIMVTSHRDTGEILYCIRDEEDGRY
jgi:hypothetical protein